MTLFDNIMEDTKIEFVSSRAPKFETESIVVSHLTSDGLAINVQENSIKTLPLYNHYSKEEATSNILKHMFKIHTMSIGHLSITKLLSLVIKLLGDDSIYGLTLIDITGNKYNIGNCFTSFSSTMPFSKLIIYSYADTDTEMNTDKLDAFTSLVCKLFAISKEASYNRKEIISSNVRIRLYEGGFTIFTRDIAIDTKNSVLLPATESSEHILVPQLFVCSGIHYPYYGVSIINIKNGSRYGKSVTPFISANIADSTDGRGSVCTGSLPSDKFDSLRSLNDCNLDSPYRKQIIPDLPTTKAWVKANKVLTIKLLQERIDNESNNS